MASNELGGRRGPPGRGGLQTRATSSQTIKVAAAVVLVVLGLSGIVHLGLNRDGTLKVPSEPMVAGWYTGSPTPGEPGPSVIVGHVDARETGPAVFYRLGQVTPGAAVAVTRRDGSVARFTVTAVRLYAKSDFPTQTVYGNTSGATLRLITCADWNDESKEYDGDVVLFAQFEEPDS